jgi:HEAT repeat protein
LKQRGKRITMAAGAAGLAALVAAAFSARGLVHERYLVWQVEHGDSDSRASALDTLERLDSAAALPYLIRRFSDELRAPLFSDEPRAPFSRRLTYPRLTHHRSFSQNTAPFVRLHRIHKKAATAALQASLSDPIDSVRAAACLLVAVIGSESDSDGLLAPLVQLLKADPDDSVRELACKALGAIVADRPAAQTALKDALGEDDLANVARLGHLTGE